MAPKTWFITGASRGFGREWAIAALERGDSVAATARDTSTLIDLEERFGEDGGGFAELGAIVAQVLERAVDPDEGMGLLRGHSAAAHHLADAR